MWLAGGNHMSSRRVFSIGENTSTGPYFIQLPLAFSRRLLWNLLVHTATGKGRESSHCSHLIILKPMPSTLRPSSIRY